MNTRSQVKVPNAFFAKSKLEYSDWRWAFFREEIQNAYDAGATKIDFSIWKTEPANTLAIQCKDNGCGMEEDTVRNVLLCLGGSKKPDGAVGGFGYAKSLLFFAHKQYAIRTRDVSVEGSGGDYDLFKCETTQPGTNIRVEMETEGHSVESFAEILRRYVSYLTVPRAITITLEGQPLNARFEDFEYSVPTELGDFSFKEVKDLSSSQVVVSVRGLPMFVQRVYSTGSIAFQGLLELTGDSLELLTANRDALKGDYANRLNRLVQRMIEDRHIFKQGTTLDITLNYTKPVALSAEDGSTMEVVDEKMAIAQKEQQTISDELRYMINEEFPENFSLRIQNTVGRGGKDQEDSTISVANVLSTLRKGWIRSLAMAWKHTVCMTLATTYSKNVGMKYVRNDGTLIEPASWCDEDFENGAFYAAGRRVTTGFVFAKAVEGINVKLQGNTADILIMCNPQCFDKAFLVGDLLDLAIHESSHLLVASHGEEFIDVDMRFRRSFRRLMSESDLKVAVKTAIADFKARI